MSRPVDIPSPKAGAAGAGAEPAQNSPTTASILATLRRDLALSPHEAAQQARGGSAGAGAGAEQENDDAGNEEDDEEDADDDDDNHNPAEATTAEPTHPPPPPDFAPFYTLITDPTATGGGAHIHPAAVHYLFADDPDGAGLLTDALLGHMPAVEKTGNASRGDTQEEKGGRHGAAEEADGEAEDHRVIIVDIGPDGREVLSVASLSPRWQALTASVAAAPSWRGGEEGQATAATGAGGLMLKIAGSEVVDVGAGGEGRRAKAGAGDEVEGLLREFNSRLGDLDRVLVAAGEEEGEEDVGGGEELTVGGD